MHKSATLTSAAAAALLLFITLLFVILEGCQPDPDQAPAPIVQATTGAALPPTEPCNCRELLIGYFEWEDCQVYLKGIPHSCTATGKLQVALNFAQDRVTFRHPGWRFCSRPTEFWCWYGQNGASPLTPWVCDGYAISASLDLDNHELDIQLDDEFLNCAFEEEEGFWFAIPVY